VPFIIPSLVQTDPEQVARDVRAALAEDLGSGDISAALIPAAAHAEAHIITREAGIMCGRAWVDEVFRQVDDRIRLRWAHEDGNVLAPNDLLVSLEGPARGLLSGERAALNFLQLLSGTSTRCRAYADIVAGTRVRLLDTRKTLPGLRMAQKYAVQCGGCHNHRFGLYDAFLIKENHISACGSIRAAIAAARAQAPMLPLEIEVETLEELDEALACDPDRIMLDNFSLDEMRTAVARVGGRMELEASGNITPERLRTIAETGVDCISIGALTKDVKALDLSLRLLTVALA